MAIDPVQERQRLIDVYSHMTDGELQELAKDKASLTGLASQVLNDEMARRELSPLEPDPSQPDPDWVAIRNGAAVYGHNSQLSRRDAGMAGQERSGIRWHRVLPGR